MTKKKRESIRKILVAKLLAVAGGASWVGSTSPAFPEHLGPTMRAALDARALDPLPAMAEAADRLAGAEPLPSSEAVRAALAAVVADTPWEAQPMDRLVSVAAAASRTAAPSALATRPRRR